MAIIGTHWQAHIVKVIARPQPPKRLLAEIDPQCQGRRRRSQEQVRKAFPAWAGPGERLNTSIASESEGLVNLLVPEMPLRMVPTTE